MADRASQLESLLESLIDLSAEERSARLDAECPAPDLRAEVEELLRHHDAEQTTPDFLRAVTDVLETPPRPVMTDATIAPTSTTIGPYRILRHLGRGGMGTVYLAEHQHLKKQVALKLLPYSAVASDELISRFRREMQSTGLLDHDNVVRASDAGEADSGCFLVMERVDGPNLEELVRQQGPLAVADACEIIRQAADGIEHAHQHGIIHRDIKPSNLMINRQGRVKVVDFGLAQLRDAAATALTGSQHVMGTIDYMSPEQATHNYPIDRRTDVYSLGATLYKLLTGAAPFEEEGREHVTQTLLSLATSQALPIGERRTDLPAALAAFIDRMLAPVPDARPESASEVSDMMSRFSSEHQLQKLVSDPATDHVPASVITPAGSVRRARFRRQTVWTIVAAMLAAVALSWMFLDDKPESTFDALPDSTSAADAEAVRAGRIRPQSRAVAAWPVLHCWTREPVDQLGPVIDRIYQLCEQLELTPADNKVTLAYLEGDLEASTWESGATTIEIRIRLYDRPGVSTAELIEAAESLDLQRIGIRERAVEEVWLQKPVGITYLESTALWTALEQFVIEHHPSATFDTMLERLQADEWNADINYTELESELIIPVE